MRELRHDFRTVYRVPYDSVPTVEAIDLIRSLPDGCAYVRATDPSRAWSAEQHRHADVLDAMRELTWAMAVDHDEMPEPPRIVRPRDVLARVESERRRAAAMETIRKTDWEDVD